MPTAVLVGKVTVVVKEVPNRFLPWIKGTVTIRRDDFVGLTVSAVEERVVEMRSWGMTGRFTLNGRMLASNEVYQIVLQPGDTLEMIDP